MIYYYTFLAVSILAILEILRIKIIHPKILYFSLMMFLILLAGFRPGVGYDYESYELVYDNFTLLSYISEKMEWGFLSLVYIFKELNITDFNTFLLFIAFISITIKFHVIKKYSPYIFISALLYFTQEFLARDFSNIRQGVSIAITAYSITYVHNRNFVKFILLIIIASLFHTTALVFTVIYFINDIRFSKVFIFTTLFFTLFVGQILDTSKITSLLSMLNIEYVLDKLNDYTARNDYSSELGITPGLIQRIVIFSVFVIFEKVLIKQTEYYYLIRNISFIGLLIFLFFNSFEIIAARGSYYFRFFDVIIIAFLINMIKDINYKIIATILILLYAFQAMFRELNRHGVFFPYDFLNTLLGL